MRVAWASLLSHKEAQNDAKNSQTSQTTASTSE
jgi:hypothetical protein